MNCDCITKVNARLKEQGFKLSDKFFMFAVTDDLSLEFTMGLPLERLDGKRLARKDPKTLQISFCPICGQRAHKDEPRSVPEGQDNGADTGRADAGASGAVAGGHAGQA